MTWILTGPSFILGRSFPELLGRTVCIDGPFRKFSGIISGGIGYLEAPRFVSRFMEVHGDS